MSEIEMHVKINREIKSFLKWKFEYLVKTYTTYRVVMVNESLYSNWQMFAIWVRVGGVRFTNMTWRFKITSDYRRWKKEEENNIPKCEFNPIADYITLMFGSYSSVDITIFVHLKIRPYSSTSISSTSVCSKSNRYLVVLRNSYNLETKLKKGEVQAH